jgi:hypothetical protein
VERNSIDRKTYSVNMTPSDHKTGKGVQIFYGVAGSAKAKRLE